MLSNMKPAFTEFFESWCYKRSSSSQHNTPVSRFIQWAIGNWAQSDTTWDSDHITKLAEMIFYKFYNWETWCLDGEPVAPPATTITNFGDSMTAIFKTYKDYYGEKLTAYETEINFLDGNSITTVIDETVEATPRTLHENVNYDLPRSDSSIDRPTSKSTSSVTSGTDKTDRDATNTIKGGDVIDLKRRYLDLIRSIYEEFALKFRCNFIEQFDWTYVPEVEL